MKLAIALFVFASAALAHAGGTETYVGIGITVQSAQKSFQIVDVVQNAPAANAGVVIGDWLTAVDQKSTAKQKLNAVVKMLGGSAGTEVTLTLEDDKTRTPRDVKLVRTEITVPCFLEGNINLNYLGNELSGFIGQDSLFLNAFGTQVSGNVNGEFINLMLQDQPGFGLTISGFIHSTYVTWRATGTAFFGYQECIP